MIVKNQRDKAFHRESAVKVERKAFWLLAKPCFSTSLSSSNIEKCTLKAQNTYQVTNYEAFLIYHSKTKKARELPLPNGFPWGFIPYLKDWKMAE